MALMVSVSGVRGLVGETLTPAIALQFAQAFGSVLGGGRIALGRDSRPSGAMYASAVTAGLIATGCEVTDCGIVMTPTLGRAIRDGGFDGGLMITASHNPAPWNGLKFLDDHGLAPDPDLVRRIREVREGGTAKLLTEQFKSAHRDPDANQRHADVVLNAVEVDLAALKGLRVLLDSVNGAGGVISGAFLERLGCEVVHVNADPDGHFPHPPEPIAENLVDVAAKVREVGAQVGFVQDPDADRLAIIDEQGRFIGEEFTLALAVQSVLERRVGPVAANLSTSRMVDDLAAKHSVAVVRTPVGEAHVARALYREEGVIGGEGNGGVIDPRISPVRDSLSAMSLVLQLMASRGKQISELVGALPKYAMIKQKLEVEKRDKIDQALDRIATSFSGEKLNRSDGVRIDFADGWVHARGSNTEPIMRFIAEAQDAKAAQALIDQVRAAAEL